MVALLKAKRLNIIRIMNSKINKFLSFSCITFIKTLL